MSDTLMEPIIAAQATFVDSVLLIDGDNDPHLPPDFKISPRTLVRVFLRLNAKIPRALEKRIGDIPFLAAITSPQTGSNAADFVMALHAGILHATLPMHMPFTIVTNDKSLSVVVQEFQRVGRQAVLWTSHVARGGAGRGRGRAAGASSTSADKTDKPLSDAAPKPARRRRSRRGGSGRSTVRVAASAAAATPATPAPVSAPPAPDQGTYVAVADAKVLSVAAAYAQRLSRIKDPPSRLKTLVNDIANRTSGCDPQLVLEELKRSYGLSIDSAGRVAYNKRG